MQSMRRILVTGAAGFAGGYLLEELARRGVSAIGIYHRTEPPDRLRSSEFEWLACDICDPEAVAHTVQTARPDGIVHLAAISRPVQANAEPRAAYRTNVGGWLNLLEAVRQIGDPCRVLLVSSSHVYGHQPCGREGFHEELPAAPHDVYGATRAAGETLAQVYVAQHKLDVLIARSFNHCGPRQSPDYFVAGVAQQLAVIAAGEAPPVLRVGNLDAVRDFTDVRDVVAAYAALLERGRTGRVYNVCSGRPVPLKTIVETLRASSRGDLRVEVDPRNAGRADVPTVFGDPTRLRQTAGWEPSYDLIETVHDTLRYWKERIAERQLQPIG